jgi:menaquinone-dependent protoporphyrinogen oxidase
MQKALVAYGTRYGAAASTSQEIAKILSQNGFEVKVANLKEEKIKDIAEYGLVVVGSGIQINRWTGEPEDFLKKHHKELDTKKLALFVCCGSASSDKPEAKAEAQRRYLDEKALKYGLKPVALGLFGGVYNYNKEPWWAKKALEADRPRVEANYKAIEPGIYDTRDWNVIRNWAIGLAQNI